MSGLSPEIPADSEQLRAAMRRFPSAVTVVTVGGTEPHGITIGSFSSASLDPPLIVFNVQRHARMHDRLRDGEPFVVHLLKTSQVHLSNHFADPDRVGPTQFDGIPCTRVHGEPPVLTDAVAVLRCRVWARYDAGDHSLFVGCVDSLRHDPGGDPVLYFDRSYRTVGAPTGDNRS